MEPIPAARLTPVSPPRGFTLVEMVVVLAIIVVISGIVISGQTAYNQSLILSDTAYTVAFSARQAQSLGLSSRTFGTGTNVGYGVNFTAGSSGSYTIFADTSNASYATPSTCTIGALGTPEWKPGNCRYNPADGIVQTYTFSRGYRVSRFCGKNGSGTLQCSDSGLAALDIVYMRPNTVSVITGRGTSNQTYPYTCAQIHVASPTGSAERVIRVSQLGEVSIGQLCP